MKPINDDLENWKMDNALCRIYMDGLGLFKFILFLKIYLQPLTPDQLSQKGSDEMNKPKLKKMVWMTVLISAVIFLLFLSLFTVTQAAGLVDDTVPLVWSLDNKMQKR